jgi:hypothetical protein
VGLSAIFIKKCVISRISRLLWEFAGYIFAIYLKNFKIIYRLGVDVTDEEFNAIKIRNYTLTCTRAAWPGYLY